MHTLFCIVGRTAVGKDTMTGRLHESLSTKYPGLGDFEVLCSYTTRARREGEGNTHIFIKPEEVKDYENEILARTTFETYECFCTVSQIEKATFYLIDPPGIECLKKAIEDGLVKNTRLVVIYLTAPEKLRRYRALEVRGDEESKYFQREAAEKERFEQFLLNEEMDYVVSTFNPDAALPVLEQIVLSELEASKREEKALEDVAEIKSRLYGKGFGQEWLDIKKQKINNHF